MGSAVLCNLLVCAGAASLSRTQPLEYRQQYHRESVVEAGGQLIQVDAAEAHEVYEANATAALEKRVDDLERERNDTIGTLRKAGGQLIQVDAAEAHEVYEANATAALEKRVDDLERERNDTIGTLRKASVDGAVDAREAGVAVNGSLAADEVSFADMSKASESMGKWAGKKAWEIQLQNLTPKRDKERSIKAYFVLKDDPEFWPRGDLDVAVPIALEKLHDDGKPMNWKGFVQKLLAEAAKKYGKDSNEATLIHNAGVIWSTPWICDHYGIDIDKNPFAPVFPQEYIVAYDIIKEMYEDMDADEEFGRVKGKVASAFLKHPPTLTKDGQDIEHNKAVIDALNDVEDGLGNDIQKLLDW